MANRIYNKQVSPKGYKRGGGVTGVKAKQEMAARPKRKATTKKFLKTAGKILFPPAAAADAGFKLAKRFKKMGGGSLKAVPAGNKGLKKLPTKVRNKMGFMQSGGVAKSARHPHSKLKTQKELKKITDSAAYKKADYAGKTKMLGGKVLN